MNKPMTRSDRKEIIAAIAERNARVASDREAIDLSRQAAGANPGSRVHQEGVAVWIETLTADLADLNGFIAGLTFVFGDEAMADLMDRGE